MEFLQSSILSKTKEILKEALKIGSLEEELSRDADEGITRPATVENTTIEDIKSAIEYLLDEGLPRMKRDAKEDGHSKMGWYISEEILKVKKFKREYLK